MRALAHLGKLLRVPEQQQPLRRHRGGNGTRQGELPGLVDDEQVQRAARDAAVVAEVPGGAADDVAAGLAGEPAECLGVQGRPRMPPDVAVPVSYTHLTLPTNR